MLMPEPAVQEEYFSVVKYWKNIPVKMIRYLDCKGMREEKTP